VSGTFGNSVAASALQHEKDMSSKTVDGNYHVGVPVAMVASQNAVSAFSDSEDAQEASAGNSDESSELDTGSTAASDSTPQIAANSVAKKTSSKGSFTSTGIKRIRGSSWHQ